MLGGIQCHMIRARHSDCHMIRAHHPDCHMTRIPNQERGCSYVNLRVGRNQILLAWKPVDRWSLFSSQPAREKTYFY